MTTQQNTERIFLDETTICIATSYPSIGSQACVENQKKKLHEKKWYIKKENVKGQRNVDGDIIYIYLCTWVNSRSRKQNTGQWQMEKRQWTKVKKAGKKGLARMQQTNNSLQCCPCPSNQQWTPKQSGRRRQLRHSEKTKCITWKLSHSFCCLWG